MRASEPVDRLRGIGPRLSGALELEGVRRIQDLLLRLPVRYEDRTRALMVADALDSGEAWVLVVGRISQLVARRGRRRGIAVVSAHVEDETGGLPVVWFNNPWIERRLRSLDRAYLYGRLRQDRGGALELVNPEVEEDDGRACEGIVPVYSSLGPLSGRRLRRLMRTAVEVCRGLEDPLPEATRRRLGVPPFAESLLRVHAPEPSEGGPDHGDGLRALNSHTTAYHRRLALDELIAVTSAMTERRVDRSRLCAPSCGVADDPAELARRMVPFTLTHAQVLVGTEILGDLEGPSPMARLVQGDVGSGKTVVAALAMLAVADSGHQAVLMAPTELLAEQHYTTLTGFFAGTPHRPVLLTSSLSAAQRRHAQQEMREGRAGIVVGTHALIQNRVAFARLGLVVVDEQHRFGAAQRQALVDKGRAPHLLVMTATPIPRSLALTLYGDLTLSVIDEMPPGRTPVRTVVRSFSAKPRLFRFLRREIAQGGRVFLVYPLIEGSDKVQAHALEDHVEEIEGALPDVAVGVLHGRLARETRDRVTGRFRDGAIQVVLSTTVVEVGVDVPEASVMVISSADRFGLSQLHQLRGRVGRGRRESWCVLLVEEEVSEDARRRLEVLCRSHDGFEIAEEDLRLRGPGEVSGTRQWGPSQLRFADLVRHRDLVEQARDVADRLAASGQLAEVRSALRRYHPVDMQIPAG